MKNKINILLVLFVFLLGINSYATKRYWRGTGATKNWNTTTNWSATSGGTTGSSVPVSTDSVYFDSGGDSICTINAAVSIKYLNIASGYTHTISQNANVITIGTSGAVLSGGTFSGGSSNITVSGVFTLSGTNFTSTSGTLTITGNYTFSGGTFSHNNGEFKLSGATQSTTGSTTLYHLTIATTSTLTISSGTILTVNNLLDLNNSIINTGDIYVLGDIRENGTTNAGGGTGTITINGTGSQTFNGQTTSAARTHGWAPNIVINKSSGTLYLKDWIVVRGNWRYTAGTVDITTNSSTVCFPHGTTNTIFGKQSLNNILVTESVSSVNTLAINTGDTLTVTGNITTESSGVIGFTGIINLKGDILLNSSSTSTSAGGTGTIIINGTGTQTINGNSTNLAGPLCSVVINKPSGTLYLKDTITVAGNWAWQNGTVDASTYSSTVVFSYEVGGKSISGNHSLYNVSFYASNSVTITTPSTDTLTVLGDFRIEGATFLAFNTGTIYAKGNITQSNTFYSLTYGTGTIVAKGTANQLFTGYSTMGSGHQLCNFKIDKTGGTLTLKNYVNIGGNWTYVRGTVDASTDTSTVVFPNSSSGRTISGKQTLYNVTFYAPTSNSLNTINATDTLTVQNTLTTTGSTEVTINTGVVNALGNVNVNNTFNIPTAVGGTGTILFKNSGNQTITGASGVGIGRLCTIKIAKPSGTLTLKNVVSVGGDWIYVSGTVDVTTNSATVCFPYSTGRTISGKLTLYNVSFYGTNACTNTITSGDTLTVTGELKTDGLFAVIINTGVINAKGDITINNTASAAGGGSGFIHVCGTGNQTFTGNAAPIGGCLCNVYIDKPSGTLSLVNTISLTSTSTWKYLQGTVNPGTSTNVFIGGATINCGTTLSSMSFNNFRIDGGTTSTLSGVLNVNGNLTVDVARGLTTNSYDITVGGNWDNAGTMTLGTSKVTFNGSGGQYLLHPSTTQTISSVVINKPVGKLYLNSAVLNVSSSLTLTKGIIASSATKFVSFPDNATCTGGSDSGYVSGPVKKIGNDAFTFPLGDSVLSTGAYHPLTITAPSATTDSYTATYRDSVQTAGATIQTDSLTSISTCERWLLTRNAGSSTVVPTLGWNSNSCNVDGCHRLRVSGWDGSQWKSLGYNGITTSGSTGTVKAHSGLSQTSLPLVIALPINASLAPTVTISCNNPTICSGHSTSITGNGASTYSWAPSTGLSATTGGTVIASPTTGITYTVTGTNALGCTGTSTIAISVNTSPTVAVTPTSSVIGTGSSVSLTASGASTYTWLPTTDLSPTTGASVTSTPAASITYTVTGTAANGCTGTATSAITVEAACAHSVLVSGSACIQTPVSLGAFGFKGCVELVNLDFGDGYSVTDTLDVDHPASAPHTYSSVGSYVLTISVYDMSSHLLRTDTSHISVISCAMDCDDCIPSFAPIPAKKYELSAWTKQGGAADTVTNYTKPKITVSSTYGSYSVAFTPSGPIIDGWQKIDGEFTLPGLATDINIKLESTSGDCYFDDIRVFPFDGSMKSYVYDPVNMRLVAELDERNYATLYEYDEEGKLVRVKKETERGIMTIKENRNNTSK